MRITAKKLKAKGACEDDIKAFEKQWPDGCNVTRKNCEIAFEKLYMHVPWAARNLLSPKAFAEYEKMSDQRAKACVEARGVCRCYEDDIEAFYQAAKG